MKLRIPEPYVGDKADRIFGSTLLLADWATLVYLIGWSWWYSFADTPELDILGKCLCAVVLTVVVPIIHSIVFGVVWFVAIRVWALVRAVWETTYEKFFAQ